MLGAYTKWEHLEKMIACHSLITHKEWSTFNSIYFITLNWRECWMENFYFDQNTMLSFDTFPKDISYSSIAYFSSSHFEGTRSYSILYTMERPMHNQHAWTNTDSLYIELCFTSTNSLQIAMHNLRSNVDRWAKHSTNNARVRGLIPIMAVHDK